MRGELSSELVILEDYDNDRATLLRPEYCVVVPDQLPIFRIVSLLSLNV